MAGYSSRLIRSNLELDRTKAINMIVYTPHSKNSSMIFGKLHITLKQHVKEGIALPLNTVNRLDRLVTVRY